MLGDGGRGTLYRRVMNVAKPQAGHLGAPFGGTSGPLNAITDVRGVEVGHVTFISGRHDDPTSGPVVRTGATALHATGKGAAEGVAAGWLALNGNGEITGTTRYDFKAGIGTASRVVAIDRDAYRVGVLVQANYGRRPRLRIAGVPVGAELADPASVVPTTGRGDGSIIVLIATDAPLLPGQLRAVAKRASLGLGRNGSIAAHTSGDLFLAFSTANRHRYGAPGPGRFAFVLTERIDPFFAATVEATEEAIVNTMGAAEPMTGADGAFYSSLPHETLRELLRRDGRLVSTS